MHTNIGSDCGVRAAARAKLIVYLIVSSAAFMASNQSRWPFARSNGVGRRTAISRETRTHDSAPVARWQEGAARGRCLSCRDVTGGASTMRRRRIAVKTPPKQNGPEI